MNSRKISYETLAAHVHSIAHLANGSVVTITGLLASRPPSHLFSAVISPLGAAKREYHHISGTYNLFSLFFHWGSELFLSGTNY